MATDKQRKLPDLPPGQILIYKDAGLSLQVRLDGQTVWLTQLQMAELFQTTPQNITLHIQSIYEEREQIPEATCKEYLQVRWEGARRVQRALKHYNLDMILAVGYRVRSQRGTQFRQWATARLSELLVKGFTLDDERIKAGQTLGQDYFDELLARIRDIRSSERLFYQKITDIYATSIDYDRNAELTREFFKTVQNKMHWLLADDFRRGVSVSGPVHLVLHRLKELPCQLGVAVIVDAGGVDVGNLLIEEPLAGANVTNPRQQFVEIILPQRLSCLDTLIVQRKALYEQFAEPGGCPLPELRASRRPHAIANRQNDIEVVVLQSALDPPLAHLPNL